MPKHEIEQLIADYITRSLDESEETRLTPGTNGNNQEDDVRDTIVSVLGDGLEDAILQLRSSDYTKIAPTADELLREHRIPLNKSSVEYYRLCRELLKAQQTILKVEIERLEGRYWKARELQLNESRARGLRGAPEPEQASAESLTIEEAISLYLDHYHHRDTRTNEEKRVVLQRFRETLSGYITTLQAVRKRDCVHFRDTYLRVPKRIPNMYRGKVITEVLHGVAVTHPDYTPVTKNTVNHALTDLHHFFRWALKHDHIEGRNPVEGIEYEGITEEHYDPYTDEDLQRMFTFPEYQQQKDSYPARYWLPLILLFTGARWEEIARLTPADVQQDAAGVYYFDIIPDVISGKRGKNALMKRKVPVHSRLIALGLLKYITQAKAHKWTRLLPKPTKGRGVRRGQGRSTSGDAVSKWFNRIKELAHVTGNKNLHSFRHTVITRLVSVGVPQDMREILVGHASSTVQGQVYTHREEVPLKLLQGHLEKLDFKV